MSPTTSSTRSSLLQPVDNTSCDPANLNGQASASGVGPSGGPFSYTWFDGLTTNPLDSIGNTNAVTGLAPGPYTVLLTEDATGCTDTTDVSVLDDPAYPVLTPVTDSDQTACSSALLDGQVSASVAGDTTNYSFFWFDAPIGSPDTVGADHVGAVYCALAAGRYYVVAKDNNLLCISDTVLYADVADNIVYPVVSASAVDNTSCDPANLNGQASASGVGPSGGPFSYTWFDGLTTNPLDSIGNTNAVTGLAPGPYTVMLTEDATGCTDTTDVSVLDDPIYPVITPAHRQRPDCLLQCTARRSGVCLCRR